MIQYRSTTTDGKCVFCEIAQGRLHTPGIFWEDEQFMAFLSTYPNTEGFTVIIPKKHFPSDVLAMPNKELRDFIIAAKTAARLLLDHFKEVGRIGVIMEGTGVDHAHIKLMPMHGTGHMKKGVWKQYPSKRKDYFEKYEGYLASHDGPQADQEKLKELAKMLRMK